VSTTSFTRHVFSPPLSFHGLFGRSFFFSLAGRFPIARRFPASQLFFPCPSHFGRIFVGPEHGTPAPFDPECFNTQLCLKFAPFFFFVTQVPFFCFLLNYPFARPPFVSLCFLSGNVSLVGFPVFLFQESFFKDSLHITKKGIAAPPCRILLLSSNVGWLFATLRFFTVPSKKLTSLLALGFRASFFGFFPFDSGHWRNAQAVQELT